MRIFFNEYEFYKIINDKIIQTIFKLKGKNDLIL